MIHPVVLAGGVGSRLWPLSRSHYPKQFLTLIGDSTLFEQTITRAVGIEHEGLTCVCNEAHRFLAAEQVRRSEVKDAEIILEPDGRNTAPAIGLAAINAMSSGKDPVLMVTPADQYVSDYSAFQLAVGRGVHLAEQGHLVTFGVVPSYAETGYGYIERGEPIADLGFNVAMFREKPDAVTAQGFIESGRHYWNGGIFLFRASEYLTALKKHRPETLAACDQAMRAGARDRDFIRPDVGSFSACANESIDYAVMENTHSATVVPLDAGWSDLGSWQAVGALQIRDSKGNASYGDVVLEDCRNTYVHGDERLVCALGLDDLIVVDTKDALLVVRYDQAPYVGALAKRLLEEGRAEADAHRVVYRPWGHYDSVDQGKRHQVKRITVKPGAKLSVQMHHHRAEHWVVVSGTARVHRDDKCFLVTENESTYISLGQVHALENPGTIDLEVIEVQSGSYLGEDDIVRFDDRYGRK